MKLPQIHDIPTGVHERNNPRNKTILQTVKLEKKHTHMHTQQRHFQLVS